MSIGESPSLKDVKAINAINRDAFSNGILGLVPGPRRGDDYEDDQEHDVLKYVLYMSLRLPNVRHCQGNIEGCYFEIKTI
jgi:hypothetical protein